MTQSFFACSCAQRPAHFEVYVGGQPVNTRYPFLCVDCFHKNVATIFADRKVEEVPQWFADGPEPRIRMPKWGDGTEVIPRSHGIVATEERVAEIQKHTDVRILELEIEGETIISRRIVTIEKEPQNAPI